MINRTPQHGFPGRAIALSVAIGGIVASLVTPAAAKQPAAKQAAAKPSQSEHQHATHHGAHGDKASATKHDKQAIQTAKDGSLVVKMNAISGFRFSVPRFQAKTGQRVKLTVKNTDQMMHNLAVVTPGSRIDIVKAAIELGSDGPAMNFVPKDKRVLIATGVLQPGQTQTLSFVAPSKPGVYPYVCTYPGHGFAMYGAMYVSKNADTKLPPLEKDKHLPPPIDASAMAAHDHLTPHHGAKVIREFMPNTGPASIAIGMPGGQSLCWDTVQCRVRFAWEGGFITIPYVKHDRAKLIGPVYYTAPKDGFPLRIGTPVSAGGVPVKPNVVYQGYRLIHSYPQFRYTVNGVAVKELIQLKADGKGITRTFEIDAKEPVWFMVDPKASGLFASSAGKFVDGVLALSPAQAKRFTVTLSPPAEEAFD